MFAWPWDPARVTVKDENPPTRPCTQAGEYGIDVGLIPPTTLFAPFAGRVAAYEPCPPGVFCWYPGRLILTGGPTGEAVGFGHVHPLVAVGSVVAAGQAIAEVRSDAAGGPHVEFMLSPTGVWGACGDWVDPRSYLAMLFAQAGPGPSPGPGPAPVLVCPVGWHVVGDTCVSDAGAPGPAPVPTATCPPGYIAAGGQCVRPTPASGMGVWGWLVLAAAGGAAALIAHAGGVEPAEEEVRARLGSASAALSSGALSAERAVGAGASRAEAALDDAGTRLRALVP